MLPALLPAALLAAHLILSEVMIRPAAGGAEWVELQNAGADPASLAGLTLEDSRARPIRHPAGVPPAELEPGGFLIVTGNVEKVLAAYPGLPAERVVKPEGTWPTLNDSDGETGFADMVVLRDSTGALLDSLVYYSRWIPPAGVSLERVDPAAASLAAANWSGSIDAGGATPLQRNSLSLTEGENDQGALIVPSVPINPEVPGAAITVGWHLDRPARLSIELVDLAGRPVRLLKPLEEAGTVGRVVWDGRNDRGEEVPPGVYVAVLAGRKDGESAVRAWRRPVIVARGSAR